MARRSAPWPRYRVSQWIDTSPESMEKEEPIIRFGIRTQRNKGGKWLHVSVDGKTVAVLETEVEAQTLCDALKAKAQQQAALPQESTNA